MGEAGRGVNGAGLPHRLERGFLLERRGILLPWDARAKVLFNLGEPEAHETHGKVDLVWRGEVCLGGLPADLHASLKRKQKLRTVRILADYADAEGRTGFDRVNAHLVSVFSAPASTVDSMGLPSWEWASDRIAIAHFPFERFGTHYVLTFRRKGPVVKEEGK